MKDHRFFNRDLTSGAASSFGLRARLLGVVGGLGTAVGASRRKGFGGTGVAVGASRRGGCCARLRSDLFIVTLVPP